MDDKCKFQDLTKPGISCPVCQQGELVPARGRFGPIYKCDAKGCKFYVDSRSTGATCDHLRQGEACGNLMVEGTKTIPDRCSDRSCPNCNPHKL